MDGAFVVTVGADTSGALGVVYVVIAVVGPIVVSEYPGTVLDIEGAFGGAVGAFYAFEVVGVHGCGGVVLMRGSKSPRNSPKLQFGQ